MKRDDGAVFVKTRAVRMTAQALTHPLGSVVNAAQRMLAVQGQDLHQARWALGVRAVNGTEASVDEAFARGQLVRSWSLRGTLHVMPTEDARWVMRLLSARNLARVAGRLRQLRVSEADVTVARRVVERALSAGPQSRETLFSLLEASGQAVGQQRGIHLLFCLSQHGVILQAGEDFVLAEGWGATPRDLEGDAALSELARRYREGHGAVSADDFAFWSGFSLREARRAFELAGAEPDVAAHAVPAVLLLPGFDEYLLGTRDRAAVIAPADFEKVVPGGNGVFRPMLVIDGVISGTWRRERKRHESVVTVSPFSTVSRKTRAAIEGPIERLSQFLQHPVTLEWQLP